MDHADNGAKLLFRDSMIREFIEDPSYDEIIRKVFASVGEKLNELEQFHPDRMATRILGMGDILTLVEKAEENIERLKARSNGLYQLMQDYKKSIGMDDFEDLFDMTDNYKMNALEEIRRQFLLTGKLTYTDKNFSLFYTMA